MIPRPTLAAVCLIAGCAPLCAGIPLQINHQGVVSVNGAPFTGTGLFRFALIDPISGLNLWTNDGSTDGTANMPTNAVDIAVSGGAYSVRLGDATFTNMVPLASTVFDTDNVRLRIWFDDGVNGVLQLAPDQPLTSAPYAFHAGAADTAASASTASYADSAGTASEAVHAITADVAIQSLDAGSGGVPPGGMILSPSNSPPTGFTFTGLRVDLPGGNWEGRAPIPVANADFALAVLNGRIHITSGNNGNDHQIYNPETNTWGTLTAIPTARNGAGAAVVDGKLYVIGGIIGVVHHLENEMYDPDSFNWTPRASMPSARTQFAVGVLNGQIHCVGGFHYSPGPGLEPVTIHEVYDPVADAWTTAAPLPNDISFNTSRMLGAISAGKMYVFGGDRPVEFDPSMNSWTKKRRMRDPAVYNYGVAELAGRVFLFGGLDLLSGQITRAVQEYDPDLDLWTSHAPIPSLRWEASALGVGEKIHVIGGKNQMGTALSTNEVFTPAGLLYVHQKD